MDTQEIGVQLDALDEIWRFLIRSTSLSLMTLGLYLLSLTH